MRRPSIVIGSVVVPRGFTAAPNQRFRVIAIRGDMLSLRPMHVPPRQHWSRHGHYFTMGARFPVHRSEARRYKAR